MKTHIQAHETPLFGDRDRAIAGVVNRIRFAAYVRETRAYGWRSVAIEALSHAALLRQAIMVQRYGRGYWKTIA